MKVRRKGFSRDCLKNLIRKWKRNQKKNLAVIAAIKIKAVHAAANNRLVDLFSFWS